MPVVTPVLSPHRGVHGVADLQPMTPTMSARSPLELIRRRTVRIAGLVVIAAALGCDSTTAPSGPVQSNPPPTDSFVPTFTALTPGQTVKAVVSADDLPCVEDPQFRCQYFRVTPSTAGTITLVLTYPRPEGNLDWEVRDAAGGLWDRPSTITIRSGWTYQITVWEYEFPGLEYELTVSLLPG